MSVPYFRNLLIFRIWDFLIHFCPIIKMRHYGQKWSLDKSSIIISHFSKGGVKLTILALQKTDSAKKK